jgi:hypothetical protein
VKDITFDNKDRPHFTDQKPLKADFPQEKATSALAGKFLACHLLMDFELATPHNHITNFMK